VTSAQDPPSVKSSLKLVVKAIACFTTFAKGIWCGAHTNQIILNTITTYDNVRKTMPMVYVSERTKKLLEKIVEILRKNTNTPARIVKSDAIHAAVEEYAKKLGVKE